MRLLSAVLRRSEQLGPWVLLCLVLTLVALLALPTIDREITFYDEGVYIATAKSIASGLGYRNISLPDSPPQVKYPPLWPLLLSCVWRLFPDFPANLVIMKSLVLMLALVFLVATYLCLRTALTLGALESVAVVAVVGFNPLFLEFATRSSSEIPMALLSMLAVYSYHVFLDGRRPIHLGITAAFALLAFLTRSIGIALLGANLVAMLFERQYRRALTFSAISAVVVIPWFAWSWSATSAYNAYPPEIGANYRGYLADIFARGGTALLGYLPFNLNSLVWSWKSFVFPWGPPAIGALIVIAGRTLVRHLWQQPRVHDLYCLFSLLLISLWPWPVNDRFVLVISPFLIAYFFLGLRSLVLAAPWSTDALRTISSVIIAIVVAGAAAHDFTALRAARERSQAVTIVYNERHRMFDWIKDNTPGDAILVGDDDPIQYLFTGRKTIRLSYPDPFSVYYSGEVVREFPQARGLLAWFRDMNACYVVQSVILSEQERVYFGSLIDALTEVSASPFVLIYGGLQEFFVVYEIGGCQGEEG